jgi:polyferredoxin
MKGVNMPKRKLLHETEAPISTTHNNNRPKVRRRRRKKKLTIEWLNLLRVSFLLFLVGMIVFHYYLITENQLGSYYLEIWKRNKAILTPMILFICYTLTIFLFGYRFGKRR